MVGSQNCLEGSAACSAVPSFPPTPDEICGNLEDDNCNGIAEEGCACPPDSYEVCGSSIGACQLGVLSCAEDGTFSGKCIGATLPSEEVCANEIDDDCDGSIDEGCLCDGFVRSCGPGTGACSFSTQTCVGGFWGTCALDNQPGLELCDIIDNDCDAEFGMKGAPASRGPSNSVHFNETSAPSITVSAPRPSAGLPVWQNQAQKTQPVESQSPMPARPRRSPRSRTQRRRNRLGRPLHPFPPSRGTHRIPRGVSQNLKKSLSFSKRRAAASRAVHPLSSRLWGCSCSCGPLEGQSLHKPRAKNTRSQFVDGPVR